VRGESTNGIEERSAAGISPDRPGEITGVACGILMAMKN